MTTWVADIATVGLPTPAAAQVSSAVDASWMAFACAAESWIAATAECELEAEDENDDEGEDGFVEWCITSVLTWPERGRLEV